MLLLIFYHSCASCLMLFNHFIFHIVVKVETSVKIDYQSCVSAKTMHTELEFRTPMTAEVVRQRVIMDNVLVYTSDYDTHWRRLRNVLNRIGESGMTLSKEKCQFGVQSVQFLGHIVSANGVQPDTNKVKVIVEMKVPTTKLDARRLMRIVGYLSNIRKKYL